MITDSASKITGYLSSVFDDVYTTYAGGMNGTEDDGLLTPLRNCSSDEEVCRGSEEGVTKVKETDMLEFLNLGSGTFGSFLNGVEDAALVMVTSMVTYLQDGNDSSVAQDDTHA